MKRLQAPVSRCRKPYGPLFPRRRLRPTAEGWVFMLLAIAVAGVAVNTGINLLYLVFSMMMSFLVFSCVLSALSLWGLEVLPEFPRYVFSGEEFSVKVTVRNKKLWLASHSLRLKEVVPRSSGEVESSGFVAHVLPHGSAVLIYPARLARRGIHWLGEVELATTYPFALFESSRLTGARSSVVVYPALGELRRLPMMLSGRLPGEEAERAAARTGGLEYLGLRGYRAGDNPRWIHWRSSARTGALMVREFAREQGEGVNIVLDTSGPPATYDAPSEDFELAVSYVTTLVHHLAGEGRRVCLAMWPGSDRVCTAEGNRSVAQLLELLALVEPGQGCEGGGVWPAVERRLLPGAAMIVVRWGSTEAQEKLRGAPDAARRIAAVVDVRDAEFLSSFVSPVARKRCIV